MRQYWKLAVGGFHQYSAYRAASLAGLFTNAAFGLLRSAVMTSVFAATAIVGGMSLRQSITYVWLAQGLMTVVQVYGGSTFAQRIKSGAVVTDLSRPIDPQMAYLAADIGRAAYHTVYRGVPPVVIGALISDLVFPQGVLLWFAFVGSLVLAVSVSFLFRFLYGLSAFWLVDFRGVALIAVIVTNLMSGFIIPVAFFPDWLRSLADATPFPSMIQYPVNVFTGAAGGWSVARELSVQMVWVLVLLVSGQFVFRLGRRRLVVQGG